MGALMEELLLSNDEFLQDDSSDVDSFAPEEDIFDLLDMLTGRRSNASASSLDDEDCYELAQWAAISKAILQAMLRESRKREKERDLHYTSSISHLPCTLNIMLFQRYYFL